MPVLPNILLGFLGGQLFQRALYDQVWYPYLTTEIGSLKSKVSALERQDAVTFYRSVANAPGNLQMIMMIAAATVLISTLGQTLLNPAKRTANLLSFISFSIATGLYALKVHPIIRDIGSAGVVRPKADVEAAQLFHIALWQALTGMSLVTALLLQVAVATDPEEAELQAAPPRSKKSRSSKVE
ncbi:hypothetical protein HDU85_007141 [Gaertneriomyces sp. JEL0708]|nr:hypothetical protein HDU85_007141 [Gaertneriomyces sp. JEL0708]